MTTLFAAGVLFAVQFLFTKQYQLRAGEGLAAAVWMLVFGNLWMGILFLAAGGFRLRILPLSLLYAGGIRRLRGGDQRGLPCSPCAAGRWQVVTLFSHCPAAFCFRRATAFSGLGNS